MNKEHLAPVLSKLDTKVETNWTTDGQPRLEVINPLLGKNGPVTREEILKWHPNFTRNNMDLTTPPSPPAPPVGRAKPKTDAEQLKDHQQQLAELEKAEKARDGAEETMLDAQDAVDKAQQKLVEVSREYARLVDAAYAIKGGSGLYLANQQYFNRSLKNVEEKAKAENAAK